jgi:hypothetical protein
MRPGSTAASRKGPVPTGLAGRTASRFGLCMAKNGCERRQQRRVRPVERDLDHVRSYTLGA